jgi:murein DD-endopeptidase MepM/ murein hydrolase activator NlpD
MQTIVPFNPSTDKLLLLDFTEANTALTDEIINDTASFSAYISQKLQSASATYGIGGYDEHRTVYSRSKVFDTIEEPRRLHLGVDIWGNAGTPVYAPIDGTVHSFAFNDQYGDYGATIILSHATKERSFHTLYGHLSLSDLNGLSEGQIIRAGQEIAHFGQPQENGHWPPHLHFQMIIDMQGMNGDFPGVCKFSERERYLANCPNPDVLLQMMNKAVSD